MIIAGAPLDPEIAAGQRNRHLALTAPQSRRRHGRSTGRRATGARQTGAAFPGADDDVRAIDDVRERDVGTVGKDRVIFQQRSEPAQIVGIDVVNPEDRVRIAHVDGRRRMQHRRIDRADLKFDVSGVAKFLGQRNFLPTELRRAHVDGVEVRLRPLPAVQQAGTGLEGDRGLSGFFE